jgi:hypothetical protein
MYVNNIDWYINPFRADRWLAIWTPALDRALAAGASASYLTRNIENPLHFRQVSVWEDMADFEAYWASDEIASLREEAMNLFHKPVLPVWHSLAAEAALDRSA